MSAGHPAPDLGAGGRLYRLGWAFYLLLAVGGVAWVGSREGSIPWRLFLDGELWWRDLGLGVAGAGLLLLLWQIADHWLPMARVLEARLREMVGPLEPGEAIGLAILSGFAEEFFFRGAVQGSWGWPVACLLFAALHAGRERFFYLWTMFAGLAGLLFAALTLWTGNLTAAIVGHVLFNGVNLYRLAAGNHESSEPSTFAK